MNISQSLQIVGVFDFLLASAAGFLLPLWLCRRLEKYSPIDSSPELFSSMPFRLAKVFSGGVILGVALLHLLVEAIEALSEVYEYPVALLLAGVGAIITLAAEQLPMILINNNRIQEDPQSPLPVDVVEAAGKLELAPVKACEEPTATAGFENTHFLTKAIVLDISVAIHSLAVGFAFGTLSSEEVSTIQALLVAVAFHQFFEGISLGLQVVQAASMSTTVLVGLVSLFSLSVPIGVMMGMVVSSAGDHDSASSELVSGYANALAGGSLLYTSLVEIIAEEFAHSHGSSDFLSMDPQTSMKSKSLQFLGSIGSVTLGFGIMAILAIWA